jgi:hypothetical protein
MHDVPEPVVGEAFDPAITAATVSWRRYAPRSRAPRSTGDDSPPSPNPHLTSSPASARSIRARVLSTP